MRTLVALYLLCLASVAQAAPITIDFEGLSTGIFSTTTTDGFNFAEFPNYSDPQIVADPGGNQSMIVAGAGSCGPFGDCGFLSIIMTRDDGGAFSYFGSDLTEFCFDPTNGSCFSDVLGTIVGGGFASGPVGSGDWLNLESVQFLVGGGSVPGGFQAFSLEVDNIVVAAVPVPAAFWLFGSALAGLGWMRRKQIF